jgi:hypothetical protein
MSVKPKSKELTPEAQLGAYLGRFSAKNQKFFKSIRTAVRKRFPAANELAYDYGTHVVISYSPSDHGIEGIVALAARDDGVRLYFTRGAKLPDPKKLLQGSAGTRYVMLEKLSQLAHPDIEALIVAAIDQSSVPLPSKGKGTLIIRPTAASKRPRPKSKK